MNLCELASFVFKRQNTNEGVFDTDIYKDLEQRHKVPDMSMSDEDKARISSILTMPDACPYDVDGTLEAWLLRISVWGKVKITHKNPEQKINRTLSNREFLEYIDDQQRNEVYGTWKVEEVALNKIRFYRGFWSNRGKEVVEELIVDIALRSDIKRAVGKMRKDKGLLGRFMF